MEFICNRTPYVCRTNYKFERVRKIKFTGILIFFILNISNLFSQDFFKVKLLFCEKVATFPIEIYIPIYGLENNLKFEYIHKQDTLFCVANCIHDTVFFKNGMLIYGCHIDIVKTNKHKKIAFLPSKYNKIKVLVINSHEMMFYFERNKKKRNIFHLYNVESGNLP